MDSLGGADSFVSCQSIWIGGLVPDSVQLVQSGLVSVTFSARLEGIVGQDERLIITHDGVGSVCASKRL